MTAPLSQEEQWQEEWIELYNRLLAESQRLAGTDKFQSVQKFLAAKEVAEIIDKLN